MRRVAVFGKPGSGKSTLSKTLAAESGIPLYPLDSIVYQPNGEAVERDVFDAAHDDILSKESWIIDGFGPIGSFYQRLEVADTLVYIDLPYITSYWLVTKRLLQAAKVKPQGWPDGSSALKGTWQSYKTLWLCPKFWNQDFANKLEAMAPDKTVYVIRSLSELNHFVSQHVSKLEV